MAPPEQSYCPAHDQAARLELYDCQRRRLLAVLRELVEVAMPYSTASPAAAQAWHRARRTLAEVDPR